MVNLHPARLTRLKAQLEDDIARETKRPLPDSLRLQALKRARLFVKDRLASLRRMGMMAGDTAQGRHRLGRGRGAIGSGGLTA